MLFLGLTKGDLEAILTTYDIKRLDLYSRNMVDYHLITDLLPAGKRLRMYNLSGLIVYHEWAHTKAMSPRAFFCIVSFSTL